MRAAVEPVVGKIVLAIGLRDWSGLKPLLHPYLHWTCSDGRVIRGRKNVLVYLGAMPPVGLPSHHEIRDAQIYRWVMTSP